MKYACISSENQALIITMVCLETWQALLSEHYILKMSSIVQDSIDLFLGNYVVDTNEGISKPSPLETHRDWRFMAVSLFSVLCCNVYFLCNHKCFVLNFDIPFYYFFSVLNLKGVKNLLLILSNRPFKRGVPEVKFTRNRILTCYKLKHLNKKYFKSELYVHQTSFTYICGFCQLCGIYKMKNKIRKRHASALFLSIFLLKLIL